MSFRHKQTRAAIAAIAFGVATAVSSVASAATIDVTFEGVVRSLTTFGVNDGAPGLGGAFDVGDSVSGSFSFDATGIVADGGGALDNLTINVDGYSTTATAGGVSLQDNAMPGTSAPITDIFRLTGDDSTFTGADVNGQSLTRMQLSLFSFSDNTVVAPGDPLTFGLLQDLLAVNDDDGDTTFLAFSDNSTVRFEVTSLSLTAVPLPAAGFLMIAALGGLAVAAGAKRRSA